MTHAIEPRCIAMVPGIKRYVVVPIVSTGQTQHVQTLYEVVDRHTKTTVCRVFLKSTATHRAQQMNNDHNTEILWAELHTRT